MEIKTYFPYKLVLMRRPTKSGNQVLTLAGYSKGHTKFRIFYLAELDLEKLRMEVHLPTHYSLLSPAHSITGSSGSPKGRRRTVTPGYYSGIPGEKNTRTKDDFSICRFFRSQDS